MVKQYPHDYESYLSYKEEIIFLNEKTKIRCYACKKIGHSLINCPKLHHEVRKDLFLKMKNFSLNMERRKEQRKRKKCKNTFKNSREMRKALKKCRENLIL